MYSKVISRGLGKLSIVIGSLFISLSTAYVARADSQTSILIQCSDTLTPQVKDGLKIDPKATTTFALVAGEGATIPDENWSYPGEGETEPGWGMKLGGDGNTFLAWSPDPDAPDFVVGVHAKRTCTRFGNGGGTFTTVDDIDITWKGGLFTCNDIKDWPTPGFEVNKNNPVTYHFDDGVLGETNPTDIIISLSACSGDDGKWHAKVTKIVGEYFEEFRLGPGMTEVPDGAPDANYCDQVQDLRKVSKLAPAWYMLSAIGHHEDYHAGKFKGDLQDIIADNGYITSLEALTLPAAAATSSTDAADQIAASLEFLSLQTEMEQFWQRKESDRTFTDDKVTYNGAGDELTFAGPAYESEHEITTPTYKMICTAAAHNPALGACTACTLPDPVP